MNEAKIAEVNSLVRKNSRNELVRLCKEQNLSYSGTKHDMAVRLMGGLHQDEPVQNHVRKIIIHKNKNGLWEFAGLIFDDHTKNVMGRLDEDGITILPLRRCDIEKCRQYKFRYNMPEVLDERPGTVKSYEHGDGSQSSDEEEEEEEGSTE